MSIDPEHDDVMRALLRRSLPARHVDPERAARVREAVHAAWIEDRPARTGVWRWAGVAGLAAAAAIAAVVVWTPTNRSGGGPGVQPLTVGSVRFMTGAMTITQASDGLELPLRPGDALRTGATVRTGPNSRGTIVLGNGIEMRVDRETTIVMAGERRLNLDRGAIYIDTAARRGPAVPIEVEARRALVRDIGTQYEVRVSGDAVRVRVRDGRVQVQRDAVVREAEPGTELTLTPSGIRAADVPAFDPEWGWIVRAAPPRQVDGRTLADFLAWVEREGGRKIRFDDPAIERAATTTIVYGTIDGLSVEEALDVVLPSCGLTHRIEGAIIRIRAADEKRGVRS